MATREDVNETDDADDNGEFLMASPFIYDEKAGHLVHVDSLTDDEKKPLRVNGFNKDVKTAWRDVSLEDV